MTRVAGFVKCPVHNARVAVDADERLLGLCDGCAGEAARATRYIVEHGDQAAEVGRAREWAVETLARYGNATAPASSFLAESARGGKEVSL